MSDFILIEKRSLTVTEVAAMQQAHTLEEAALQADVHPDLILYYCRAGLFGTLIDHEKMIFDDAALYELRRIEHYRRHHSVNLRALPLVIGLLREIDNLDEELRFLRGS
jgi:hypothetical protein